MPPQPGLVSAIVPAFNAETYVTDAIESILGQVYEPIECIVVDDGSSDATVATVGRFGDRVRLIRQDHTGVSSARNRGAAVASGEYLAFLDSDDRWLPERVKTQIEVLSGAPKAAAVVCGTQVVDASLRPIGVIAQDPAIRIADLLLGQAVLVSTGSNLLITRTEFEEVGGFDERLAGSEDWTMTFALTARGTLTSIPEPLVEYRVHGSNMSADAERLERDMLQALDQVFGDGPVPPDRQRLRRRAYANLHRMIAGAYFAEGRRARFLKHAVTSVATHPSALRYFLSTAARRRRGLSRQDPFGMAGSAKRP